MRALRGRAADGPPFFVTWARPIHISDRPAAKARHGEAPMTSQTLPPPIPTGLSGRCPRCGDGHLFSGFLALRPSCEACGLDYASFDSADGPAFFVMSIVGLVVVGLALWMEITFEPPMWVHALVAGGLSVGLSLVLVRPLKGLLIALQYANKAEQGRFKR